MPKGQTGSLGLRLSPCFVEWMMGLAIGWTEIGPTESTPSETPSSRKPRRKRGASSKGDSVVGESRSLVVLQAPEGG